MASKGIFCLEGEWEDRLTDRVSVRPALDMLMTLRGGRLIHRNAATPEEFAHYFGKWAMRRYNAFPLAYLAYHGHRGGIDLGGGVMTLDEVAALVPGKLAERVVYFGACETLAASDDDLLAFVETTGAKAVIGYTRQVRWEESAAFDFTLLPDVLESMDMRRLHARLAKRHPYFLDGLGLRIVTASWVSPRRRTTAQRNAVATLTPEGAS
ncbi:DUF6642 family protein [Blastococcus sp. SYSU D00813]